MRKLLAVAAVAALALLFTACPSRYSRFRTEGCVSPCVGQPAPSPTPMTYTPGPRG